MEGPRRGRLRKRKNRTLSPGCDALGQAASHHNFEQGDAGLVSTADDYLAFARMLLATGRHNSRQLLSATSVKAMTTNHLTPQQRAGGKSILGKTNGWGYGMSVAVDAVPGNRSQGQSAGAGDSVPPGAATQH